MGLGGGDLVWWMIRKEMGGVFILRFVWASKMKSIRAQQFSWHGGGVLRHSIPLVATALSLLATWGRNGDGDVCSPSLPLPIS